MLEKDLDAGFNISTINKVWKNLIPDTPYMRAQLPKDIKLDKFKWEKGAFAQLKADAQFMYIWNENGKMIFESRQGSRYPTDKFQNILFEYPELALTHHLHGEMCVYEDGELLPREEGNGILTSILKGGDFKPNQVPRYIVWDITPNDETVSKGKCYIPYSERFAFLESLFNETTNSSIRLITNKRVYSYKESIQFGIDKMLEGAEGAVIKKHDMIWKDGNSTESFKIKAEIIVEMVIIGFNIGDPTGKHRNTLGTIICESSDGLVWAKVSGMKDKLRDEIWNNQSKYLGKIISVVFNDIFEPDLSKNETKHTLYLARSAGIIRDDKLVADSMERIYAQFEAAKDIEYYLKTK
jgi:DNA ligase-1